MIGISGCEAVRRWINLRGWGDVGENKLGNRAGVGTAKHGMEEIAAAWKLSRAESRHICAKTGTPLGDRNRTCLRVLEP